MTNINELIQIGRQLELYQESEQTDAGNDDLDALWQSIYDVYHLVVVGIIEGDTEDLAMEEAKNWLIDAKKHTEMYKDFEV